MHLTISDYFSLNLQLKFWYLHSWAFTAEQVQFLSLVIYSIWLLPGGVSHFWLVSYTSWPASLKLGQDLLLHLDA